VLKLYNTNIHRIPSDGFTEAFFPQLCVVWIEVDFFEIALGFRRRPIAHAEGYSEKLWLPATIQNALYIHVSIYVFV